MLFFLNKTARRGVLPAPARKSADAGGSLSWRPRWAEWVGVGFGASLPSNWRWPWQNPWGNPGFLWLLMLISFHIPLKWSWGAKAVGKFLRSGWVRISGRWLGGILPAIIAAYLPLSAKNQSNEKSRRSNPQQWFIGLVKENIFDGNWMILDRSLLFLLDMFVFNMVVSNWIQSVSGDHFRWMRYQRQPIWLSIYR